MEYLLDTNACIVLMNRTSDRVRERFSRAVESGASIWVSSVSLYELWYGVGKNARAEANAQRLKVFLTGPVRVLEFGEEDARHAGEIRSALERAGKPIGAYDVLIAGQAIRRDLNLVTANAREFARVKNLQWEDWAKA